jgi:hypothetical protein
MTEEQQIQTNENSGDMPSPVLNVISFLIPLAGAIIYFLNKESYPIRAKAAGRAALFGLGVGLALNLLLMIV